MLKRNASSTISFRSDHLLQSMAHWRLRKGIERDVNSKIGDKGLPIIAPHLVVCTAKDRLNEYMKFVIWTFVAINMMQQHATEHRNLMVADVLFFLRL
jgi:hypothetical protein